MAGKKKKTMANKLAKMSDEERARYMQHRAEIEEEAKRRKEQLIATFMKKKVKKEEAFTRLNIAKINQNWHQILRKIKCKEMKENIEHLKEWVDRVIAHKNRSIEKLLKDLEDAEEDYLSNFNSHSNNLEDILKKQSEYVDKLNEQYLKDLNQLLISAEKEREIIFKEAEEEQIYLRTILYRQEVNDKVMRKEVENYMQKYYEAEHEFQSKLQSMMKSRKDMCEMIWKDIEAQIEQYVEKTDARRLHFAELKKQDAEGTVEIIQNEERIKQDETEINNLKEQLDQLHLTHEHNLSSLNKEMNDLKQHFSTIRKNLQKDLLIDDQKIKFMVEASSQTIEYLENIAQKGEHIKNLAKACKQFETDREKVFNWFSVSGEHLNTKKFKEEKQDISLQSKSTDDIQEIKFITQDSLREDIKTEELKTQEIKVEGLSELSPHNAIFETPSPETNNITSIQNITLYDKCPEGALSPFSSSLTSEESQKSDEKSSNFVDNCLKSLEPLENFWVTYNKVEVDYLEMQEEKKLLEQENKQLRGMIRAILEAAALSNSIPNSKVSTRVPSRKISACSAPLRRLIFS